MQKRRQQEEEWVAIPLDIIEDGYAHADAWATALERLEAAEKALRFVDTWMQTPAPPWPNAREAENAYAVGRVVRAALAREEKQS